MFQLVNEDLKAFIHTRTYVNIGAQAWPGIYCLSLSYLDNRPLVVIYKQEDQEGLNCSTDNHLGDLENPCSIFNYNDGPGNSFFLFLFAFPVYRALDRDML